MVSKKLLFVIAVVAFSLATVAGPAVAQAGGEVSFGIRPTKAVKDRPETFSYFSYEVSTGSIITDEALVINDGGVPITLKLYAADGITAQNGGTAFAQPGQESTGASRGTNGWISLPVAEVSLGPGEEMIVPFTVSVPANAVPGHHVAGLVVEAQPIEDEVVQQEGQAQFAVNVVRRVGVAVVMDVAGEHVREIGVRDVRLQQQSDQGATFRINVHNSGNVYTKGEGVLVIEDSSGAELASIPWTMDTVLPGDTTFFMVTHPINLADGDYLLTVALNTADGTDVLEDVAIQVRDGQPVVEDGPAGSVLPPQIMQIGSLQGPGIFAGLSGWTLVLAIGGIVLLVAGLVVAEIIIWRKIKRARRESDERPAA